jgi:ligand-binding sensor domain-containing protein
LNCPYRYCLVILVLLCPHIVLAQTEELYFENYTSLNGLSQNSCFAITQDAAGCMWFGTQDGLNRYDGKEFKVFLPQQKTGKALPSNYITSLFFDTYQQQLWIGTIRGACIFYPATDTLQQISKIYPAAALLESTPIKKILHFREHEYWFITYNKGLLLLNTATGTLQTYFNDEENSSKVNSIVWHQGKLIVAVAQHLFYLVPENKQQPIQPILSKHNFPEIKELFSYNHALWVGTLTAGCYYINTPLEDTANIHTFNAITNGVGCFAKDATGNLWIGTRGKGIIRYDPRSGVIKTAEYNKYDHRTPGKNFVLSLFPDRQHLMWCGLSGGGIAKYDPLKYQFTTLNNEPLNDASLPDNMIFSIYKTRDGQRYIGSQNKGLFKWDVNANQFQICHGIEKFNAANNTIYGITEDDHNNLWLASWGGLMSIDRKNNQFHFLEDKQLLSTQKLYAVHKLKSADSLFITGENGPVFFNLKTEKWQPCTDPLLQSNAYIGRYIHEDDTNCLWICTEGGGLIKYDYVKGKFEVIQPVSKYATYIRYLLQDGNLFWLATDNGIIVYDHKKQVVIKHVSINQGSTSNVCYAIQKDNKGFFWVSTNTGLFKINPHNYSMLHYDQDNGLSFLEFNTACTFAEEDGTLLFGGVGGITKFNPTLLKENEFSPDPFLTSININGVEWPLNTTGSKTLFLDHTQNTVTLTFAVTNFSNHNKNQFAYRLSGLNNQWGYYGNDNTASYNSLQPGKYIFELKTANSDGKWSQGITALTIFIHPPWWQSWWFRIGIILIVAGIAYWMVRRRINHIRYEAALKQKITATEMMALRAQMNPHFIFNCINSIDALIQSNDKYHATVYLNKFAKLLRNILDSSKQHIVTLAKDLETLQLYIDLEQLRYENKFTATIKADELLLQDDYKVPPLIIQPYVENAILHGLKNRSDNNGKLLITVSKYPEYIEYLIEDNGVGRDAPKHNILKEKSYGMQMSQDRVRFFNNEENAAVVVTDLKKDGVATGTKVQVRLNIQ